MTILINKNWFVANFLLSVDYKKTPYISNVSKEHVFVADCPLSNHCHFCSVPYFLPQTIKLFECERMHQSHSADVQWYKPDDKSLCEIEASIKTIILCLFAWPDVYWTLKTVMSSYKSSLHSTKWVLTFVGKVWRVAGTNTSNMRAIFWCVKTEQTIPRHWAQQRCWVTCSIGLATAVLPPLPALNLKITTRHGRWAALQDSLTTVAQGAAYVRAALDHLGTCSVNAFGTTRIQESNIELMSASVIHVFQALKATG